jgi:hypothetical protein
VSLSRKFILAKLPFSEMEFKVTCKERIALKGPAKIAYRRPTIHAQLAISSSPSKQSTLFPTLEPPTQNKHQHLNSVQDG